jgi:hypothetical protein
VFSMRKRFTRRALSSRGLPRGRRARLVAVVAPVAAAAALSLTPWAVSNAATARSGVTTAHTAATAHMWGNMPMWPAASPGTAPAAPTAPYAAAMPVMTFKMNGKTVSIGGRLKSGAERIAFTVTGEPQGEPGLIRLDPGVTLAQFFKDFAAAGQDPNNLYGIGQIVMSAQANKGTSSVLINLAPGTYVALDLNLNVPPTATFAVTRAKHPAALPKPGATISSREFGFTGATKVRDGELVNWANAGFLVHMIFGAEAPNLATADKIAADLKAGNDNGAQALAIGTYDWDGALSHGQSFESVVSQAPGYWVIACFMETQDGREHTLFGMERVIQIVK